MRIGIGGFFHETNSFSNIPVPLSAVRKNWTEKQGLIDAYKGVKAYIGGFIDEAEAQGVELCPTVMSRECPCGHIAADGLEAVRDGIVTQLWEGHQEKPFDAIALHLHGAAVADEYPDVDGEIIRAVREKFGPDMPIGVVLDLHGNITDTMMECSTILIGLKTYPHVDEYGASRIMFSQLCDHVREGFRVYKRVVRLPWHMVPAEGLTTAGPGHDVQQLCYRCEEKDENLLQATFFQGFPYSDITDACVSVVTMAKTQESADRNALEIARYAWGRRHDFAVVANSAEKAMELAMAVPAGEGPVVVNESSDNTGGGAPGDGTHLLREMLRCNVPDSVYAGIYDPEVAELARKAGIGGKITCKLGGKMDNLHGEPIELVDAYVKNLNDGTYINYSPKGGGNTVCYGTTACLQVGNVSIVVVSGRTQPMDDGVLRIGGMSYEHTSIVAVKSSQHFRAWWASRARAIVPCDSPGIHCADLTVFDFKFANKDYFPLKDAKWEEA